MFRIQWAKAHCPISLLSFLMAIKLQGLMSYIEQKNFKKSYTKWLRYLYPASMTYIERKKSEERTRYNGVTKITIKRRSCRDLPVNI